MEQLTIHAYAKINLALYVLNRRPDGYHTVRMIMQSLSVCDTLF
jgi:4-diphosphocytidyl-2-C-methyl-D-erythritol kinase